MTLNNKQIETKKATQHQQSVSIIFPILNPDGDFQSNGMQANVRTPQPRK